MRALNYGSACSQRTFENGHHFIRGSVPVTNTHYSIIGMISAGYPIEKMRKASDTSLEKIIFSHLSSSLWALLPQFSLLKG